MTQFSVGTEIEVLKSLAISYYARDKLTAPCFVYHRLLGCAACSIVLVFSLHVYVFKFITHHVSILQIVVGVPGHTFTTS